MAQIYKSLSITWQEFLHSPSVYSNTTLTLRAFGGEA